MKICHLTPPITFVSDEVIVNASVSTSIAANALHPPRKRFVKLNYIGQKGWFITTVLLLLVGLIAVLRVTTRIYEMAQVFNSLQPQR